MARIDVRNGYHIKTINCEGVKKLRTVEESIYQFSLVDEHDELIIMDNVASLYGYQNWLLRQEDEYFYSQIPLSIGGGINTVESAIQTLQRGADKIVINTSAIKNPKIVEDIAYVCGRQAVILQIDSKLIAGEYMCLTHGAREITKYKVYDWIRLAQGLGAGEVYVTSVDSEGTNNLFPNDLANICSENTTLPIILSGGINNSEQIRSLFLEHGIYSFSISSFTNRLNLRVSELRKQLLEYGLKVR